MKRFFFSLAALIISSPIVQAQPPLLLEWNIRNDGLDSPQNVTGDAQGNVYVSHADGLAKYSNEGELLANWPQIHTDMAVAPSGEIFLLNDGGNMVRLSPDGMVLDEWSARAGGVAVDRDGYVYVTRWYPGRVRKYTPGGDLLFDWLIESPGGESRPTYIEVDADGNVFFTDGVKPTRIRKYNAQGVRLTTWTDSFPDGNYLEAVDITLDRWGNLYVADPGHGVVVYDASGKMLGWFETPFRPSGVAVDGQGNIFVDRRRDVIQKFGPFGPSFSPVREAAVMLHVVPADTTDVTCGAGPVSVDEIVTEGHGAPGVGGSYYVFLLSSPELFSGSQTAGISGVQLGIDYHEAGSSEQGLHIHDWTHCGSLEFAQPQWPAAGSGNTITWSLPECQQNEIVTAGFFYLSAYSPSRMTITGFPPTGKTKVANCLGAEMDAQSPLSPVRLGWIALEESGGCNPLLEPCFGLTSVEKKTWGSLKVLYKTGTSKQ